MRNLLLFIAFAICMGTLSAQESYSLKLRSIVSVYENVLGEAVEADVDYQLRGWNKTSDASDYLIEIKFLDDLDPQQHTRKRGKRSRYHYEVQYLTPVYTAKIVDRNGHIFLNKTYGAKTMITPFGKDADISSIYQLQEEWTKQREIFYQTEEAKYNNINDFLNDLAKLLGEGLLPPIAQEPLANEEVPTNSIPENTNELNIEEPISNDTGPIQNTTSANELKETSNNTSTNSNTLNDETAPADKIVAAPEYKLDAIRRDAPTTQSPTTDMEKVESITSPKVETPKEDEITKVIESVENESFDNSEELTEETGATDSDNDTTSPELDSEKVVTPIAVPETKPETALEKRRRLQKERRDREEWERIEEEDVRNASSKSIRPRHVRLGLRLGAPILAGLHAEGVLPVLDNRISIVGDFSILSLTSIFETFLDDGESLDNIDLEYRHYSIGANYYFGKRIARGWYVGASYFKSTFQTDASLDSETVRGEIDLDAVAGRIGINMGRKLFMFGIEAGLAVPFEDVRGTVFFEEDGLIEAEQVNQSIPIVPMFNLTFGVAL